MPIVLARLSLAVLDVLLLVVPYHLCRGDEMTSHLIFDRLDCALALRCRDFGQSRVGGGRENGQTSELSHSVFSSMVLTDLLLTSWKRVKPAQKLNRNSRGAYVCSNVSQIILRWLNYRVYRTNSSSLRFATVSCGNFSIKMIFTRFRWNCPWTSTIRRNRWKHCMCPNIGPRAKVWSEQQCPILSGWFSRRAERRVFWSMDILEMSVVNVCSVVMPVKYSLPALSTINYPSMCSRIEAV